MNAQSSKNLVKKLVSFAGIASTTLFFSFPSFALTNPNASSLNQLPQKGQDTLMSWGYGENPTTGGGYRWNNTGSSRNQTSNVDNTSTVRENTPSTDQSSPSGTNNGQSTNDGGSPQNPTTSDRSNTERFHKNPTTGGGVHGAPEPNWRYHQNSPSSSGYQGNPTTGGGYQGDWLRLNNPNSRK